jgi:hypothetical protein
MQAETYQTIASNHAMELAQNIPDQNLPPDQNVGHDQIIEPMSVNMDQPQVVEISQGSTMEYVVMNNTGQKISLQQLQSQGSPDHLILPQHQQEQLRQILDAQKIDLAGIDMSKVIIVNPQTVQNVKPKIEGNIQPITLQQLTQPRAQHSQQIVSIPMTVVTSAPAVSSSNMQIFTVDQLWNNQTLQVVSAGDLLKATGRGGGDDGTMGHGMITTMAATEMTVRMLSF